jgi:hypothetical protein
MLWSLRIPFVCLRLRATRKGCDTDSLHRLFLVFKKLKEQLSGEWWLAAQKAGGRGSGSEWWLVPQQAEETSCR